MADLREMPEAELRGRVQKLGEDDSCQMGDGAC